MPTASADDDKRNSESSFPPTGVSRNKFTVVFRGVFTFEPQQYRFVLASSEGARMYVDENLILDEYHHLSSPKDPVVENMLVRFEQRGEHVITVVFSKRPTVKGGDRAVPAAGAAQN